MGFGVEFAVVAKEKYWAKKGGAGLFRENDGGYSGGIIGNSGAKIPNKSLQMLPNAFGGRIRGEKWGIIGRQLGVGTRDLGAELG